MLYCLYDLKGFWCGELNKRKFLLKILSNNKNVKFNEFTILVESFGFNLSRTEGSHHIYRNENVSEIINLQNVGGEAKPYQIKQFLSLIEKYDLKLED